MGVGFHRLYPGSAGADACGDVAQWSKLEAAAIEGYGFRRVGAAYTSAGLQAQDHPRGE
jgi:hypothetical protein